MRLDPDVHSRPVLLRYGAEIEAYDNDFSRRGKLLQDLF